MDVTHPTNDPALPSYHRPELQVLLPSLELAVDCWSLLSLNGRGSEKAKYLPKETAEPADAYRARLNRTSYSSIYRDAIRGYAGLLNRFQIIDPPPSMLAAEQNIDLQGSSVYSFYNHADEFAIRDGGVFIAVDMPPSEGSNNYLDEQRDGRSPYLMLIERRDVVNWSVEYVRGREFVSHATVRQIRCRHDPRSFGSIIEPIYLVLRPGSVETFRMEKRDGKWTSISEGIIETSLPMVSLVWYGATSSRFAQGDLPMNGLAEMSLDHYKLRSDLVELLHKVSMPVPVRKGAPMGANGRPAPLILGPNTAVDLPEGSDFSFAEPSGKSLERHQSEISNVEGLMDRSSLQFLFGSAPKTATEASLRAAQTSSQVTSLIRNKASSFTTIMRLWAAYAGELDTLTPESGAAIGDSLISRPIDPSGIAQMVNLHSAGILSKRTVLEELQRGAVLDPELKVEEELKRIDEELKTVEPVQVEPPTQNPFSNQ